MDMGSTTEGFWPQEWKFSFDYDIGQRQTLQTHVCVHCEVFCNSAFLCSLRVCIHRFVLTGVSFLSTIHLCSQDFTLFVLFTEVPFVHCVFVCTGLPLIKCKFVLTAFPLVL